MTTALAGSVDVAPILVRLADLGPPSEVRGKCPQLAAEALGFDRVLLTSVVEGQLIAEALYAGVERRAESVLAALREHPVPLGYPMAEGELLRRRRAQVITSEGDDAAGKRAFAETLGWSSYVAAPIVLDGTVIGFFHADRERSGAELSETDAANLASFAVCFALVYERAVLRHRIREQRQEMREVANWADARTSELGNRSVGLSEQDGPSHANLVRTAGRGENALRDLLTKRELEVLKLMVRGETNGGIARDLVVSEGTIKFHVKNILRKLHAANRAEATSRYLRLTLGQGGGTGSG